MTTRIVTVDIGGTHARFALADIADDGAISLGEPATLHTRDHASFQTAWEHFAEMQGGTLPEAVSIAIAGPVGGEIIRFTNNPWVIRPALIPEKLGAQRYTVINDFGAVGHAVATAGPEHFIHLAGPDEPLPGSGTLSIVGPAPALAWPMSGATAPVTTACRRPRAAMWNSPRSTRSRMRSSPACASAIAAFRRSALSPAPALSTFTRPSPHWKAAQSSNWTTAPCGERGTSGQDSLAAAAVDRFCLSLGSFAGDIALAQGASGVVIAGGLGLRIKDTLLRSGFANRFTAKGRFAELMARCRSS